MDSLPLLLLLARSARVRSSPRTYSTAAAASPAGGRREGRGLRADPQPWGSGCGEGMEGRGGAGPRVLACGQAASRPAPQDALAGGRAASPAAPAPFSPPPPPGHKDVPSEKTGPGFAASMGTPLWTLPQGCSLRTRNIGTYWAISDQAFSPVLMHWTLGAGLENLDARRGRPRVASFAP